MPKLIAKCNKCGFDFRENELINAYEYDGGIYCENCLTPIEEVVYYKLENYDVIDPEEVKEVYLTHGCIDNN